MIKAILVDDEPSVRNLLSILISEHCPDVQIVDQCSDLSAAVRSIRKNSPDIVFLDIEMPGHSGLELLDFFNDDEINFSIIFTTAYSEYAVQAFDLSAVGYLLKPIRPEQLIPAIDRFKKQEEKLNANLDQLRHNLNSNEEKRITLTTKYNVNFVKLSDILYIKGDGAYSEFVLLNNEKILVSKNLKTYEDMLNPFGYFIRISKQHIINKQYVVKILKGSGSKVLLKNDVTLQVSPEKEHLLY